MSLREFVCSGCGDVKKFTVEQAAAIPACMMCGFYGWSARESIGITPSYKVPVTGTMRRVAAALATVKRKKFEAGIVARTKDGEPRHGPPSVTTMNGRIFPPTHAEDIARMRESRVTLMRGESVDYVAPNADDHLVAKALNEITERAENQSKQIEVPMTPAMWGDAVNKRLAEYENMGFIDPAWRKKMVLERTPIDVRDVGRVMNSDEGNARVEVDMLELSQATKERMSNEGISHLIETGSRELLFELARHFNVLMKSNDTDEEMRVRLRAAHARKIEDAARTPTKPHVSNVQCTIACAQCGHANVYPLGSLDVKESTCTHRFRFAPEKGMYGALICTSCPLTIDRGDLERLNIDPQKRYDAKGNDLADVLTQLRAENTRVLADNARLRMHVESLERKAKARR